jgi:hypothetical protein
MHPAIDEDAQWYKVPNFTDKYNYGWFSKGKLNSGADDAVIEYDLTLPAGKYMLTSGTREYWPSSSKANTRPYKIEITDSDGNVLASVINAIVTEQGLAEGTMVTDTLFFTLPADGVVYYKMTTQRVVAGGSGNAADGDQGHEVSWLAVAEQGAYATVLLADKAEGLKTTTLVENYTPNTISGSSILAVYDAGKLSTVSKSAFADLNSYSADGRGVLTIVNNADSVPAVYDAKMYIWDEGYLPLCEAQIIP